MFVLTPSALLNPGSITIRTVPKQVIGRGLGLGIRGTVRRRVFWRILFEQSLPRYMAALLPFLVAMAIWPGLALPTSQAPLLMFLAIWLVESRVLTIASPEARRALIGEDAAARALDLLRLRGREVLTRIAAKRRLEPGAVLHLVVEQSELARVAPLTVVSVQVEGREISLLDLDGSERALIEDRLFGAGLDERLLQRVNLAERVFLRAVALDPRTISAHARLAAMAEA